MNDRKIRQRNVWQRNGGGASAVPANEGHSVQACGGDTVALEALARRTVAPYAE